MTFFEISLGERASWQLRAATELASILQTHRDLPIIAWTVGYVGATLVGQVNGPTHSRQVRARFESWRSALALGEHSETGSAGGTIYLRVVADRNRVQIRLSATVFDDEGEDR